MKIVQALKAVGEFMIIALLFVKPKSAQDMSTETIFLLIALLIMIICNGVIIFHSQTTLNQRRWCFVAGIAEVAAFVAVVFMKLIPHF